MSNSIWAKATSALWQSVNLLDWRFPSFVLSTFRYDLLVSGEQLQFSLCELSEAQDGIFKRGFLHLKTRQHKRSSLHQDCVPILHVLQVQHETQPPPRPLSYCLPVTAARLSLCSFTQLCIQSARIQMSVFVQWYVQYYMYCKFTSFVTLKNFTEL